MFAVERVLLAEAVSARAGFVAEAVFFDEEVPPGGFCIFEDVFLSEDVWVWLVITPAPERPPGGDFVGRPDIRQDVRHHRAGGRGWP